MIGMEVAALVTAVRWLATRFNRLASQCAAWIKSKVETKSFLRGLPQSMLVVGDVDGSPARVIVGHCPFTQTAARQLDAVQGQRPPERPVCRPDHRCFRGASDHGTGYGDSRRARDG